MKFALARVEQWNLGLSASAVAASLALETPHFATSLAAGAFLEAVNLGALRRAALRFFGGELSRSWTGAFALRFLMLAAGIFLTLQAGANPVAMLIGLSIAMPAVLVDAWINRPPILDPATLPVFLDDETDDETDDIREAADPERHAAGFSLTGELFTTGLTPSAVRMASNRQGDQPDHDSENSQPESADAAPDETNR
jgi:hypothetical protein